jgi:hypothetical protein
MKDKQIKFKLMKVRSNKIQEGDIVFTKDKSDAYFILKVLKTALHEHKYYKVKYLLSGDIKYWYEHEIDCVKEIMRFS